MNKRFFVLDSFRGISAVLVLLYHVNIASTITETAFIRGCDVFVLFFFTLSGFVLAHRYAYKEREELAHFLPKRIFRLFPLHVILLIVFIALESIKLVAYQKGVGFQVEPFTGKMAVAEILPNMLLVHSITPFTNPGSFNYPSWSISVEFFMYVLFFVTVKYFRKWKIGIWSIFHIGAVLLYLNQNKILIERFNVGLICFLGGNLLYVIWKKRPAPILSRHVWSILELLCIVAVCCNTIFNHSEGYGLYGTLMLFGCVIYIFSHEKGVVSKVLLHSHFKMLGTLSYSIYMTHAVIWWGIVTLFTLGGKVLGRELILIRNNLPIVDTGNVIADYLLLFILLLVVYVTSSITYRYIERPGITLGGKLCANSFTKENE